jgi:hypothetical protein
LDWFRIFLPFFSPSLGFFLKGVFREEGGGEERRGEERRGEERRGEERRGGR